MQTLNNLEPGDTGLIVHIEAPEQIKHRLMDLGLIEGARVEMMCCAPLGDPILVRVLGAVLALRRNEAEFIEIGEISETSGEGSAGRKRHRHRFSGKSKQRENQPL